MMMTEEIARRLCDLYPAKTGDFYDSGILYCGVCGKPKREIVRGENGAAFESGLECDCYKATREKREREDWERIRRDEADRARRASGMSAKLLALRFGDSEPTEPLRICRNYLLKFPAMYEAGQGLLLWGQTGTGKTHACACVANGVMETGRRVLFLSLPRVTQMPFQDREELFDRARAATLLVLDDLGAERASAAACETVYTLIDQRYTVGRPMIISTNTTLGDMRAAKDPYSRIYDRLFEVCFPVKFDGGSRRLRTAKERYDAMKAALIDGVQTAAPTGE